MVIVELSGGLGNQLFKYAMGRAVAERHSTKLKLDIAWLKRDRLRSYRLHHFHVCADLASDEERKRITGESLSRWRRSVFFRIQCNLPYYHRAVVREQQKFVYDPNMTQVPKDVLLKGDWQNPSYFQHIKGLLKTELSLRKPLSPPSQKVLDKILASEAVSLHVRRGDYISNPQINRVHGICDLSYYEQGIDLIEHEVVAPHFFIFSDDIEWTSKHLVLQHPVTYVTHNGVEKDYEDLWLMSQCKHHIIANSTFSWWGAWLGECDQSIVIAPKNWLHVDSYNTSDLTPENWYRV